MADDTDIAGSGDTSETPVTFDNIGSIALEPADTGSQEAEQTEKPKAEPDEKLSDTPPDKAEPDETDAEEEPEESEEDEDEGDDTPPDDESAKSDDEKPKNVNKFVWKDYRKLKTLDEKLLTPIRDANVPPEEQFKALQEYAPNSAENIARAAAKASVDAYADQWMAYLVGDDKATVESVKAKLNGNAEAAPAKQAPVSTTSKFESIAETPEAQKYISFLNEQYGKDKWRDPENDDELLTDDLDSVRVFRANLAIEEKRKTEFDAMQAELDKLKPAVEGIAKDQETQIENEIKSVYQQEAASYEQSIETYAIPAGLKAEGLLPEEGDSEEVKFAKEHIASKFEPIAEGYPSPFVDFISTKFSGREQLQAVQARIQKYLDDAAALTVKAKREQDPVKRDDMKSKAATLKAHADDERTTVKALAKKSVREFATAESAHIRKLLDRIAILEAQTQTRLRTEVVGAGAAAGGTDSKDITFDNLGKISL